MKLPNRPPTEKELWAPATADPAGFMLAMQRVLGAVGDVQTGGEYLHWDKLRFRKPPSGLTLEQWWMAIKLKRKGLYKPIPLRDRAGGQFVYGLVDSIAEALHFIDLGAGGQIQMPDVVTNPDTRDQYCISSLVEEAITSSQLEGATTTRPVAKEMIRTGRPPRDRSEQMILNNYVTMQHVRGLTDDPLTPQVVCDIHRLVTEQTLDDPSAAGRPRRSDQRVIVGDDYGQVFHDPPPVDALEERMVAMCDFANGKTPDGFLHPALRSIILHFWLAYDHPFVDGNGRTARALFYWSMLRHKFWLCEFLSISHIIRKAPVQYGMAFLYTETDENDLTYFILYHLKVIQRAVDELHAYIQRKASELHTLESRLRGMTVLNHRQRSLVSHAIRHPNQAYTIESHRASHGVVYETARTDLLDLQNRGLLIGGKVGRTWRFRPVRDLERRLAVLI